MLHERHKWEILHRKQCCNCFNELIYESQGFRVNFPFTQGVVSNHNVNSHNVMWCLFESYNVHGSQRPMPSSLIKKTITLYKICHNLPGARGIFNESETFTFTTFINIFNCCYKQTNFWCQRKLICQLFHLIMNFVYLCKTGC